ncbi:hypothetical protein ABMY20_12755 [Tenacibaculum sp. SSH1-16]|uniref:hypothetical protein n=1 Tax=Tenacibaculum sp. SSH1-16 TaxID=3136667 RepID=UPI0032C42977
MDTFTIIKGKDLFDLCSIDLNHISCEITETTMVHPFSRSPHEDTLKIGNTSFSTNSRTEIEGIEYMLHHIDTTKNIAYILPVSHKV